MCAPRCPAGRPPGGGGAARPSRGLLESCWGRRRRGAWGRLPPCTPREGSHALPERSAVLPSGATGVQVRWCGRSSTVCSEETGEWPRRAACGGARPRAPSAKGSRSSLRHAPACRRRRGVRLARPGANAGGPASGGGWSKPARQTPRSDGSSGRFSRASRHRALPVTPCPSLLRCC